MGVGSRGWVRGRCLGRGSTAGVYLAASMSDGMQSLFAVKSAELSRSAPVQREQHILSSLCSPHVVACFGSDVTTEPDGRVLFNLFMEYVPGAELSAVVKRHGGLDEHAISVYARGILNGLAYLHSRGIVHCDVKGQNILVREGDQAVKLADLGCAKRVEDGREGRGIISGTPLYMAPEVARGEEQGPAADIWALGCTVIEMATRCSPWGDVQDPVAAIHRIAFSNDVPDIPCTTSDVARDFLGRCLSRDPRERWSAEELLNHSFVKFPELLPLYCPHETKRNSPKSTLDQVFLDSWPEEDGEEDEAGERLESQHVDSARKRLQQLFDGVASPRQAGANPTSWEESSNWITIRNSENLSNASCEQQDEPSPSAGPWSVAPAVLAGYSGGTVVSMESYLPSQPSVLPFALVDANASDSHSVAVVGDEGYDLVLETQNFIDHANRLQTLCRDPEQDTCDLLLLQGVKSYGFPFI